jgi:hypothetical protein
VDRNDIDHRAAERLFSQAGEALVIPATVLVQFDQLARIRPGLGPTAVAQIIGAARAGAFLIAQMGQEAYDRTAELCVEYAYLPLGFVSATVIAVSEQYHERKIATFNQNHLGVVRSKSGEPFVLLP